jgi:hypothetical protein
MNKKSKEYKVKYINTVKTGPQWLMEKYRVHCAVYQEDAKTRRVLGKDEMNTL